MVERMAIAAVGSVTDLIEIVVTAVSVLGGCMAYFSGREASRSVGKGEPIRTVGSRIDEGLADGFDIGLPTAAVVAIVLAIS